MEKKTKEKFDRAVRFLSINEPELALSETGVDPFELSDFICKRKEAAHSNFDLWLMGDCFNNLHRHLAIKLRGNKKC